MRAAVSTADLELASLLARVRDSQGMEGADLAASQSVPRPYHSPEPLADVDGRTYRVAAYDFGLKRNILRMLAANGCDTTIFPAKAPPQEILAGGFDGVFLSNGPGDPAATTYGASSVRELLGRVPVFG